jgi:hypothetical protein
MNERLRSNCSLEEYRDRCCRCCGSDRRRCVIHTPRSAVNERGNTPFAYSKTKFHSWPSRSLSAFPLSRENFRQNETIHQNELCQNADGGARGPLVHDLGGGSQRDGIVCLRFRHEWDGALHFKWRFKKVMHINRPNSHAEDSERAEAWKWKI